MFGHSQTTKLFLRWTLILTLIVPTLGGYPGQSKVKVQEANASSTLALAPVGGDQPAITATPAQVALPEAGNGPAFVGWDRRGHVAFAPDHLIVRFRPGVKPALDATGRVRTGQPSLDNRLAAQGVVAAEPLFLTPPSLRPLTNGLSPEEFGLTRIYYLRLRPGTDVQQAAEALAADPSVEWAEPDYIAHAAFTPNDPRYPDQWGLPQIQAPQAWDVTQGSPAVAIAVVDTGIDLNHPDLAGKLWVNPGEIPGNGIDDDGNGKVDDVNGWDWVNNDNVPQDDIGHGTHVAGIAAAATNNGTGVAGVCPNCRVMALKVLDAAGSGTYSNIAAGILYAADKGAKVINLSLGGYADSQLLRDAVAYASQYAVVVAAAGNDNKQDRFYPAAYDDYVVAVAATDNNDQKAAFSNYGDWVDIAAPGVSIWSTLYDDTYTAWSGSSMAAPFVSGVAGLVRSRNPSWSAGAARGQLLHTADGIDGLNPGYEGHLGTGRVNAYWAVTVTAQPEISVAGYSINGVPSGAPEPGSTVTMTVALRNTWGDATGVTAVLSTTDPYVTLTNDTASYGDIPAGGIGVSSPVYSFTVASSAGYDHPIPFLLVVMANGSAYTTTLPLTITTESSTVWAGGFITSDTTWTNDHIYEIVSNVQVNQGVTLTIQPGTQVRFRADKIMQIAGTLIADGQLGNPIVFTSAVSNTPGAWGPIILAPTATSAIVDAEGNYISGTILRNVRIEYGHGLKVIRSQPYLSDVTFIANLPSKDNGILYFDNATYESEGGTFSIINSTFISNQGEAIAANIFAKKLKVLDNLIIDHTGAGVSVGNAWNGAIIARNRFIRTRGLNTFYVSSETVIEDNYFSGSIGPGYTAGFGVDIYSGSPIIKHNVFANNGQGQTYCNGRCSVINIFSGGAPTVISNTFSGNWLDSLIYFNWGGSGIYQYNNWVGNQVNYIFYRAPLQNTQDVTATFNYWGTTDAAVINGLIYDYLDDLNPGQVFYQPVLASPETSAPAFLWNAEVTPNPVGIQQATFTLTFSKAMDQSVNPTVTFGISPTYDTHIVSGNWVSPTQWVGTYNVTYYTGDGVQRLRVAGAVGADDGMEIPEDTRFTFTIATIGATSIDARPGYGYVALSWSPSDLPTVAGYNLYRSTTPGGPYTRLNPTVLTTTSYTDTNVTNGITYYYVVKLLTTDLYEMAYGSETAATPNDYTAPTTPVVVDDGTCTPYTNRLHAAWSASDPDSGISEYQYSIGTWAGGTDVINWTSMGTSTEVTRTGLSLIEGVTYYFNVKARNGVGTWSSVGSSDGILVSGGCPAVDFTASPRSGYRPLSVQFTDQSVGSVLAHLWDFGDGTTSTLTNPLHTYDTTGIFTVTLTVTGSVATNTQVKPAYITVNEPPPVADFTASPVSGVQPLRVVFTDTSTGLVNAWLWDFGDGITSTLQSPTHTYTAKGVYTVTLAVSGPGGSDEKVKPNYITVYEPVAANFSAMPTSGDRPLAVTFTNQSTGDFTTNLWDFGDGVTSTLQSPAHTYTAAGVYTVSLTVSGPGGTDTLTRTNYIRVNEPPPVADFTASPRNGPRPLTVQFTDLSSGLIEAWLWDFGDGITSTLQSPTHTYTTKGVYTVTLAVSGPGGSDTETKAAYITVTEEYKVYLPLVLRGH